MKNSIIKFIRATLTGGIIFLLPIVLFSIVLAKAIEILIKISQPLANVMNEKVFGFDGSMLVAIVLLVIICFIGGLLFRSAVVKKWIAKLEDNMLIFLPGYALIKSITADTLGEQVENELKPVLVKDEENWNMGFLVEEDERYATVFVPDAPRYDAGEVRIVPIANIKKLNVSVRKFSQSIKNFGSGTLHWLSHPD